MTIRLKVKNVKPYREISPEMDGKKIPVVFGCKVYEASELHDIRKQFQDLVSNPDLELVLAKLQKLEETGDKADESFYDQRSELRALVDAYANSKEVETLAFYKEQILFIKHASLEIEDEAGKSKDLSIADSRTAAPVESLWESPDECLVVLLDTYLSVPSLRDSLIGKITDTILNINVEDKVKNLK